MKNKQRVVVLVAALTYLAAIVAYTIPVYNAESAWAARRQELIGQSGTVYVTPSGEKYHRAYHYHGRDSPVSLYEATEQGYEPCLVCRPPAQVALLNPPNWFLHHWLLVGFGFSIVYWLVAGYAIGKVALTLLTKNAV